MIRVAIVQVADENKLMLSIVGPSGPTGPRGGTGPSGGPTGAGGPPGLNGATGPTGDVGATGANGIGTPGATGATGPRGNDGTNGVTGSTGPTGASGVQGPTGPSNGVLGPTGPTGPNGGPTGPTGAGGTGPTGATGPGFANVADVLSLWQAGDTVGDYTNALTRAIATGLPILFRYNTGTAYTISAGFSLPSNCYIFSDGPRANITKTVASTLFALNGVTNVSIKGLVISCGGTAGHCFDVNNTTNSLIEDVDIDRPQLDGVLIRGTSTNVVVRRGKGTNSTVTHGVELHGGGVSKCIVTGREFGGNLGFGIILTGGTDSIGSGPFENELSFNKCYSNGLELIGITYECHHNRIIGNHAEGTGDNGISITGHNNLCVSNVCVANMHTGIFVYGYGNTVAGNVCRNNGQEFLTLGTTVWGGIVTAPAFGGQARNNTITGNTCVDDQAVATQGYGIHAAGFSYSTWAAGVSTPTRSYIVNNNNVYVSTSATANTGASPPVHTSGSVSDGGVTWLYLYGIAPGETVLGAAGNTVVGNTTLGNSQANERDDSGCSNTFIGGNNSPVRGIRNIGPVGTIPGVVGDVLYRTRPTNAYLVMYVNNSSVPNNTFGWYALQPRAFNPTAARPNLGSGFEGAQFWDTTKNQFQIAPGAAYGGNTWVDALGRLDPAAGLTATGTSQSDGLQLKFQHSEFTTVPLGAASILPTATFGGMVMNVRNDGANDLLLFPSVGVAINALGANNAYTVPAGQEVQCWSASTTQWFVARGQVGPAGAVGATGPIGSTGPQGAIGPTGPTGSNGAAGAAGPTGPSGSVGSAGAGGATGPTGPTGANGAQGPAGTNGTNGSNGAVGPTGPAGIATISSATVAGLGSASPAGQLKLCTDLVASQSNGNTSLTGGGSLKALVVSDGANWRWA